ncbi:MAG: right-handed parallel beta-helix repeat-containing protein [Planctomycetota bacterium]
MHALARFVAVCTAFAVSAASLAGPLTPPPGAVASTGKTTDQIEPRTPISPDDLPITISQPGSYYLTSNYDYDLAGTPQNAITITTSAVTIDLNGFRLNGRRGGTPGNYAIDVAGSVPLSGITIRNGTINSWGRGAILAFDDDHCVVEDVFVSSSGQMSAVPAIWLGEYGTVRNCRVRNQQGVGISMREGAVIESSIVSGATSTGIAVSDGAVLSRCSVENALSGISITNSCRVLECSVRNATGGNGITGSSDNVLRDCTVSDVFATGIRLDNRNTIASCVIRFVGVSGIVASLNNVVEGCIASDAVEDGLAVTNNSVIRNSNAYNNGRYGFLASRSCHIENNAATNNDEAGIRVFASCTVINNAVDLNRATGATGVADGSAGILVQSGDNRIEANHCTRNDVGMRITSGGNFAVRNTASGNVFDAFNFVVGNRVGPLISGTGPITTSQTPLANWIY